MGYVKEPDGVDFLIKGKPLTDQQKQIITDFIKADKERIVKTQRIKNRNRQHGVINDKS